MDSSYQQTKIETFVFDYFPRTIGSKPQQTDKSTHHGSVHRETIRVAVPNHAL